MGVLSAAVSQAVSSADTRFKKERAEKSLQGATWLSWGLINGVLACPLVSLLPQPSGA